jgi:hypothetical protein
MAMKKINIFYWVVTGLMFDTFGAFYSHLSSGDGAFGFAPAMVALILVLGAYDLYTKRNSLQNALNLSQK